MDTKVAELSENKQRRLNYLEIGCAVGNTMFPLAELYKDKMYIFGFDFSHNAVNCIRQNHKYDTKHLYAFVGDLVKTVLEGKKLDLNLGIEKYNQTNPISELESNSDLETLKEGEIILPKMDFASLVFVLSAINPEHHLMCLTKIFAQMDPQSYFYFRDYAKYDLAMLRFAQRKDAKISENFYVKSDGTRCYYF